MPDNPLIDTSIGLVFLFLTLGLICSAMQEAIASALKWRAANLSEGIERLLGDDGNGALASAFYAHPLVSRLARPGQRPSYVPSSIFATVLMDLLRDGHSVKGLFEDARATVSRMPEGSELRQALLALIDDAGDRADAVRQHIEAWFDGAMERVSGWYKRKAQLASAVIALTLTVILNVDAIEVAKRLWAEPPLRVAALANADALLESGGDEGAPPTRPAGDIAGHRTALAAVGYPLGWPQWMDRLAAAGPPADLVIVLQTLVGWAITAAAVALGAPFWFDLLSRFVRLRGAGARPAHKD